MLGLYFKSIIMLVVNVKIIMLGLYFKSINLILLKYKPNIITYILCISTDEVNFYFSLPILPKNECPYKWWGAYRNTCSDTYKLDLSKFSKKVLCAPASSVKSERLFSTTGNIFEAKRNRLLPEHGEQIAFLNYDVPTFIE